MIFFSLFIIVIDPNVVVFVIIIILHNCKIEII